MLTLILLASLTCPATSIINRTNIWNDQDDKALSQAVKGCARSYERSPCLKEFTKVEESVYTALCGAKSEWGKEFEKREKEGK